MSLSSKKWNDGELFRDTVPWEVCSVCGSDREKNKDIRLNVDQMCIPCYHDGSILPLPYVCLDVRRKYRGSK